MPKPFPIFIPLFYMDGQLYAFMTVDLVILVIGIAVYLIYSEKRKRDRALRAWEAQVQAETRYYVDQATEARRLADQQNAQAILLERDIQSAIERFEADDREEARRHEEAKRAIGYWEDGR